MKLIVLWSKNLQRQKKIEPLSQSIDWEVSRVYEGIQNKPLYQTQAKDTKKVSYKKKYVAIKRFSEIIPSLSLYKLIQRAVSNKLAMNTLIMCVVV